MRLVAISIFLDLMKGITSRLTILSPNDVDVTTGLTLYWTPCLDLCVPTSISWNVVLVIIAASLTRSSPEKLAPCWGIVFVKFCCVAILLASAILNVPKLFWFDSVNVSLTVSPTKSVCHPPQSTSLNPVWTLIPKSETAASYAPVSLIIFALILFVSVQVSESGLNLILPW